MNAYVAYFLFCSSFFVLLLIPQKFVIAQYFSVFLLLLIIWGGSVQNGADWIWYSKYFFEIAQSDSFASALLVSSFEPGFVALMYSLGYWGIPFQGFVFVCAAISIASWIYFVRNAFPNLNIAAASFLIFLINGWTLYNEQLRQALALSVCLIGFIEWKKDNKFLGIFLVFLAFFFHRSAFMMLILFCLEKYVTEKPNRFYSFGLIIFLLLVVALMVFGLDFLINSGVMSFLQGNVIYDKLVAYNLDEIYGQSVFSLGMISYLLGFFVVVSSFDMVKSSGNPSLKFYWFISLLWCLLGPLLRIQSIFTRFEHYLLAFFPILLCVVWEVRARLSRFLVMNCLIILFVISFVGRIFFQPSQSIWINNYQNVFFNFVLGMDAQSSELRKINICDNLRDFGNNFCDGE